MTKIKIILLCETRVARAIKLKEGNIWKLLSEMSKNVVHEV